MNAQLNAGGWGIIIREYGVDDDNDGLADCLDPDCTNPSNGGVIAGNETNCGLYLSSTITEQNAPNNIGAGTPDYQWEQKIGNNDWIEIGGAIQATYAHVLIKFILFRQKL